MIAVGLLLAATCGQWYEDNPTYRDRANDAASWLMADSPEDVGLDGKILDNGAARLARRPNQFSFLVVRRGRLAFERYFNGSQWNDSNNVHSVSKSILGAVTAIAASQGKLSLNDPVARHLPRYYRNYSPNDPRRRVTIRNLLTMTSGHAWQEDLTEYDIEYGRDWTSAIIHLPIVSRPGREFNYSTGNTHLLAAVLQAATGETLKTYAQRELFDPLGIAPEHWGKDPQGINSGGYNFYITPREMAKFGLLYLNDGKWREGTEPGGGWQELVPKRAVKKSRKGEDYGQLWWLTRLDSFGAGHYAAQRAEGYGGQYIYVIPRADIVVVLTANSRDDRIEGKRLDADRFVERYVMRAIKFPDG